MEIRVELKGSRLTLLLYRLAPADWTSLPGKAATGSRPRRMVILDMKSVVFELLQFPSKRKKDFACLSVSHSQN